MAYSQKCKSQIRTRSGRIIKNKKCFCCKQSKLITKASARKRRNVKKDERPTLSELENLAKTSIKQTQQLKRKSDESSTSGIRKTLSKKSHLIEENERKEQPATLQNISEEECIKDSANKNDSRFSFGKNTEENQISNNPPEFVELVINLNENGIGTHLNQELSTDQENQMKPQNKSEKKVTEDLDNKTTNENSAQNLSERYYIQDIFDFLNKKKIQKELYNKMIKCPENKITLEKLKANFPRRSLMRDFFDSLNKGEIRNPEERQNLGGEKQMGPKIESEKRMTEDSENKTKENQTGQNLPRLSLINDLLNFLNKLQISKLEDNETLGQQKNNEMTDDENKYQNSSPMEESNLETLLKIRGQENSKQIDIKIKMMTDLITTLKEKQNNISKMLELYVDVSQDQKNDETLIEDKNRELLLKTLKPTEKETNYKDSLQELPLQDEINAEVSLQESLPEPTNNDFILRDYLSEESNFNHPLQPLQYEGPSTEVEENEEIKNLEEISVYLTIQETDIESNELQFQETNDTQTNDQNENTSEQHQNQNIEQNNISSEQNRNDDQGELNSQSNDQSHNASKSTENGENMSPGESTTNEENDKDKVCVHIQRIRVYYIKNEKVKLESIKEEMTETEPKPGFSGMKVDKKEAKEDVKIEECANKEENIKVPPTEESDHVLDSGVNESGSKFAKTKKMPHTNTNTYPNHPSNIVFQVGRTEKTLENEKQRAFIKDLRDGKVTMLSKENDTFDEDEGIYCIICGKRNLQTRYIFIDLDEVDYGSLSSEEILERYWYDNDE